MDYSFFLRRSNPELDAILEVKGGLFYPPEGDEPAPLLLYTHQRLAGLRSWAENTLYDKRPCPIEFGLICANELNAFAYTSKNEDPNKLDFIGINIGPIGTLYNIFHRILSVPDSFSEIGNPDLETKDRGALPYLTTNTRQSGFEFQFPNCPIRQQFASELAQIAIEFLFLHELGHLRNGHVDFVRQEMSFDYLPEAFDGRGMRNANLIWQTLEFDADAASLVLCAAQAHTRSRIVSSNIKDYESNSALKAIYENFETTMQMVSYSIYIAFRLFDLSEWSWMNQPNLSHPSPLFRLGSIAPTFFQLFSVKPIYETSPQLYMTNFEQTLYRAEIDCGLIQGTEPDPRGIYDFANSPQRYDYLHQLEACWKEIRPLLNNYVRGGNLAP
ncbi:hypothetical protein QE444_002813 [Pseudomonas sp. SORGH_AS199]|uniref:hypothetical protein n=1 Tax=Pseudomonas sp. SORGH_AS_0199 TaxID=3041761 RepID=UPI00285D224B|nr:hypothetical protein [Pseudomonas sp. SORGH_AS_0199]MDR6230456.1 hypothetical protein [Pseudomonas sp. SORGH_AS_0199]